MFLNFFLLQKGYPEIVIKITDRDNYYNSLIEADNGRLNRLVDLFASNIRSSINLYEEFMNEEKKITSQFDNDPIAKLRARELDLQAQENARKKQEGEERLNLDKMRAMMNQQNQDEKLEQNEELAKLRANTSIEKTILSKTIPSAPKMDKPIGNVAIIRGKN